MRKRIKTSKLSRTTNERKQLFRNLTRSLVSKGYLVTSEAKAKAVRPLVEKLVTTAKSQSLTSFRRILKRTGDIDTARGLVKLGSLFSARPGGYVRLIKLATQAGDNTQLVRMEWVEKFAEAELVSKPKPKNEVKSETKVKPTKTKTERQTKKLAAKNKGTKKP